MPDLTNADASDRREAMKDFLTKPDATEVAAQTPTAAEEVETVEELLTTPTAKEPAAAGTTEEVEPAVEVEETDEEREAREAAEEEEEDDHAGETEEEREAREAAEAEAAEAEEIPPERVELLNNRSEVFDGLVEALDGTDYPIPQLAGATAEEIAEGTHELGLRLADAHAMYDIVSGKAGAEAVFDRLLKFQGQATHDRVLTRVLEYAAKVGLIEATGGAGAGAGGEKKPAAAAGAEDPRDKEIRELHEKLQGREATEATQVQTAARNAVALKAVTAAADHAKEIGMSDEDYTAFVFPQLRGLGQDKAIFNRCSRGNFVDLIRVIDQVHARLTGRRVTAGNQRVQDKKIRDKKLPKRVAGEDRTARRPADQPTADLSTPEGRRAAAKASLRG